MNQETPVTTNAELSRLLFEAREEIEMWADVVERRTGKVARHTRDVLARLDEYRAARLVSARIRP